MQARDSYGSLAPAYDLLTGAYGHDRWLSELEKLARDHGLTGTRLLDVACGTGASFLPMLARGYNVTACDISPEMLDLARSKAAEAELHVADMRELPRFGSFDLVTCIDDALNYVLNVGELRQALRGISRNLESGGIAIWDLNTVSQYRGQFTRDRIAEGVDLFIAWRGSESRQIAPGDCVEVSIEVFASVGGELWRRTSSVHRQRHWPRTLLEELVVEVGMELADVRGQFPGAVIGGVLDELVHTKAIYVARKK